MSKNAIVGLFAVAFVLLLSRPVLTDPIEPAQPSFDIPAPEVDLAKNPGRQLYTPTRLEWIAVVLNSGGSLPYQPSLGFSIGFTANHASDTLQVRVRYRKEQVKQQLMESVAEEKVKAANALARHHGWDRWMKVEKVFEEMR